MFMVMIFFLSSCDFEKQVSIEECKKDFAKLLDDNNINYYEKISTIGKYGDSFVFSCYDEDFISIIENKKQIYLGGVFFDIQYQTNLLVQYENQIYDIYDGYNMGLLLNEDVLDIKEKVL